MRKIFNFIGDVMESKLKNAHIIRGVSSILSVREDDALKTVEKFMQEIVEMKKELKSEEVRKVSEGMSKI